VIFDEIYKVICMIWIVNGFCLDLYEFIIMLCGMVLFVMYLIVVVDLSGFGGLC